MVENKSENIIWIVFLCFGIIFFIIGLFVANATFNYENKIETTAIITEISSYGDGNHQVYVSYVVDGKKYESRLNGYSSSFYEGKEIKIYYDEENPNKVGVKSLDLLILMFPGFGILFMIIGGAGILLKIKNKFLEKKLRKSGKLVYADYVQTVLNRRYSVNGVCPYNIICEWNNLEDGKKYILKSKNIWINPEILIDEKNIKTFPVYINLQNKKQYFIDVQSLNDGIVDLS